MAAAPLLPPSASTTAANTEKTNYIRLSRLLVEIGTAVLQDVFDSFHPPSTLHGVLNSSTVNTKLQKLRAKNIIYTVQWDTLYPKSGAVTSKDFDITLLYLLLRNICNLKQPSTGWDNYPSTTDQSMSADVLRIKMSRNKIYAHAINFALNKNEFDWCWAETEAALTRLDVTNHVKSKIQRLRFLPLDIENDECYKVLLRGWEDREEKTFDALTKISKDCEQLKEEIHTKSSITIRGEVKIIIPGGIVLAWAAGSAYFLMRYRDDPETVIRLVKEAILPSSVAAGSMASILHILLGSFIIIVGVDSLQALDFLWKRYEQGQLKKDLEDVIVTDKLRELAKEDKQLMEKEIEDVVICVSISEDHYIKARKELQVVAGDKLQPTEQRGKNKSLEGFSIDDRITSTLLPEADVTRINTSTTSRLNYIKDLRDNTTALGEFSKCLDPQFKCLKNWEHLAFTLGVPPYVIRTCKLYLEHSPTIKVFEYLAITRPDMTIDELRDILTRNERRARPDIKAMLEVFKSDDKVSEVITNSTDGACILDQIAVKLDSASRPTCNWMDFGLQLGIARDKLHQFEMYNYNPTEALFRFLYATSKETVKASVIIGYLVDMNREDVLAEIRKATHSIDLDTTDAKDILKIGSDLLDSTSKMLNKENLGLKGWRGIASRLIADHFIDEPDIIRSLEPPHLHEIHSPTKKIIEWLAANRHKTKLSDVVRACKKIQRSDAIQVLMETFSRALEFSYFHEEDSPPSSLRYGIQETSEKGNILKSEERRFGLPESTAECMLRVQERDELVSYLSSGRYQMVVLHSATGYGKTSLVLYVADELIKNHGYTCIYINSKGVFNLEDFAVKILSTCGIPTPNTRAKDRVKMLFKNLNQKCVLIVDNVDHMFHANATAQINDSTSSTSSLGSPGMSSSVSPSLSASFPGMNSYAARKSIDMSTSFAGMPSALDNSSTFPVMSTDIPGTSSDIPGDGNRTPVRKHSGLPLCDKSNSEKDEYQNFLIGIIQSAPNVAILVTSWESLTITKVNAKQKKLHPLPSKESKELLLHKCKSVLGIEEASISDDLVNEIVRCCSGFPLLLCSAVTFIKSFRSFDEGANQLIACPLEQLTTKLSLKILPCEERFNHCLGVCFDRLEEINQKVLLNVSVFPGPFSSEDAGVVLKDTVQGNDELEQALTTLRRFNFLSQVGEKYYMSFAIRSFVIHIATETDPRKRLHQDALSKFVDHTFEIISGIERDFFSRDCRDAIRRYKDQEENLREIARWCISESHPVSPGVKESIIESFAKIYWIMKLMRPHLLKIITRGFAKYCKPINSRYYIESLIYAGATFVKCCHCQTKLCPFALREAMTYFKWAIEAMSRESSNTTRPIGKRVRKVFRRRSQTKRSLSYLETIDKCTIISEEAKAEMLVKYGKCIARNGLDDGLAFIETGIEKRCQIRTKNGSSPKTHVMIALGYHDLACAFSYLGSPVKSIEIRENIVLPVYKEHLGLCHPFASSAQSHLANSYHTLQFYEKAIKTCATALKNRMELLGEHPETASSLFDMGRIRSEQASLCDQPEAQTTLYEEALEYLQNSLAMREKLAYTPNEIALTHSEICYVLKRLERHEEAKEHEEKIYQQMKKMDDENDRFT